MLSADIAYGFLFDSMNVADITLFQGKPEVKSLSKWLHHLCVHKHRAVKRAFHWKPSGFVEANPADILEIDSSDIERL